MRREQRLNQWACALAGLMILFVAGVAQAQLPSPGARVEVEVQNPGNDPGPQTATGPITASLSAALFDPDEATADAEATVLGEVKSRASSGGASGNNSPSRGHAESQWVAQFVATGTDPGVPIDVAISFSVDGNLTHSNNNSGAGAGDILSGVSFQLSMHDTLTGEMMLWEGDASLSSIGFPTPPDLSRNGDWANPARDGDFDTTDPNNVAVSTSVLLDDAFSVDFGELFAIDVELVATSFTFAGFEAGSGAEFFDTGSVSISTGTPGVTFVAIPEPAAVVMLTLGILASVSLRWRASA